jgi:uncharacterized membrane protein YdjX (TVP38/TMEM64 family)
MKPRILLRGLLLIAVLLALAWAAERTGLRGLLSETWIDSQVRGRGLAGETLFVALGALLVAVGVPRHVVGFLGGYAFGFLLGVGLALAAEVLGCVMTFYYARVLGSGMLASSPRLRKIDDLVRDNPFRMTLLIRLLPVGNNLAVNLGAGVSSVRGWPFLAGSAIGYVPQTVVFALVGSGVQLDPALRITTGVALFVVSGLLGVRLFWKFRREKTAEEVERRSG